MSNSAIYGREYGNGRAWVCENFSTCGGSVGTHPDGRPLGNIPDPETRKLRVQVHAVIDPLWKSKKYRRGTVYKRIAEALGLDIFHVGEADAKTCRDVLATVPLIFQKSTL